MRWLALGLALALALGAQASCEGNSCPQQRQAARAAGLLGSPANCADKKYPAVGTVPAVRQPALPRRRRCLQSAGAPVVACLQHPLPLLNARSCRSALRSRAGHH